MSSDGARPVQGMLTLQNADGTRTFRVRAAWAERSFDLTVLAEDDAWTAHVSERDVERLASERGRPPADYYAALRRHLTDADAPPSVAFDLAADGQFTVALRSGARSVVFFAAALARADFRRAIYGLLDELTAGHSALSGAALALRRERAELERENRACADRVAALVERKRRWERETYSGVVALLNEKKRRIRFLTDALRRSGGGEERISDSESGGEERISDSESGEEPAEPVPGASRAAARRDEPGGDSAALPPRRRPDGDGMIVVKSPPPQDARVEEEDARVEEEEEEGAEAATPQLEFSTQDLIDRM